MTVAVAWTRQLAGGSEELVFVSDSRYSGDGRTFDACPKILPLPRSDCAIAFAGYTGHALPMMLQLVQGITSEDQIRRRSKDLSQLKAHAMKVFDSMSAAIASSPGVSKPEDTAPNATFLFGGYSGRQKTFELWTIFYQSSKKAFEARPAPWLYYFPSDKRFHLRWQKTGSEKPLGRIAFAGDQGKNAQDKLLEKLKLAKPRIRRLDWEPFEVVRDILRDKTHNESIGGAPQLVKVYQYLQSDPLGVFWPHKQHGHRTLLGRNCLEYENLARWIIDPDTLLTERWPEAKKAASRSILVETE